jgi:signal transduction histidine kinase/CheY-like chemotaxis protein
LLKKGIQRETYLVCLRFTLHEIRFTRYGLRNKRVRIMKMNQITSLTWQRVFVSILIIFIASAIRLVFFGGLGRGIPYLTYYPAVMIAAIYGGLFSGLLATVFSSLLCFYWVQKGLISPLEWLAMAVFLLSCTMISAIAEAMRRANRRAMEAQVQAQNANQAKSAFLANMSHELRTPLNAILGYSQLMQRDTSLPSEHCEYLSIINRSGEHLLALINEVLEISKIEAKRITIDLVNFNIHNLILDLKNMFEVKTKAKGLLFEVRGINDLPRFIIADETKLRIILTNLIGNAIKFTQSGGVIIRFSIQKDPLEEEFLLVEVEDTGPGIAEAEKDKLFKYFMQTESGKQTKSGTGLGLAISQDYAKMLDGEITVRSSLGAGSTFYVKIRIKEGTEEDIKTEVFTRRVIGLAPGQNAPRVLVAEDTEESRFLLVKLLRLVGLDVREAANGSEAIKIFEAWKPVLIWMDIRMPVMDGLEATRIIKATEPGKQTKIIALSAHVLGEEREDIFAAGCDDFVGKPYRENELFDIMEKHLALQYIYEETQTEENAAVLPSDIVLNLYSLDIGLRSELNKAVTNTDAIKIAEIAEQIQRKEPALALALQMCAKNFDYDTIRNALQNNLQTEE